MRSRRKRPLKSAIDSMRRFMDEMQCAQCKASRKIIRLVSGSLGKEPPVCRCHEEPSGPPVCPACKQKAGASLLEEPEMEDLEFDGENISGVCHIVLHSDCCGKPMQKSDLEVIQDVDSDRIVAAFEGGHLDLAKLDPLELDYRVHVSSIELIQYTEFKPTEQRYYGYTAQLEISAVYQGVTATIYPEVEDQVPASDMENI